MPDSGNRYLSKVFDDDWMRENGFLEDGLGIVQDLLDKVKPPQGEMLITAQTTDTVDQIIHNMREKCISQFPVFKGKELCGLISEADLLKNLFSGKLTRKDKIESIVSDAIVKVSAADPVEKVNAAMTRGLTPMVMRGKSLIAIISKIDFITYLSQTKTGPL